MCISVGRGTSRSPHPTIKSWGREGLNLCIVEPCLLPFDPNPALQLTLFRRYWKIVILTQPGLDFDLILGALSGFRFASHLRSSNWGNSNPEMGFQHPKNRGIPCEYPWDQGPPCEVPRKVHMHAHGCHMDRDS